MNQLFLLVKAGTSNDSMTKIILSLMKKMRNMKMKMELRKSLRLEAKLIDLDPDKVE